MNKKKRTLILTAIFVTLNYTVAFAGGGSGDVVTNINLWGQKFVDIFLTLLKWGGIISFSSLGIWLLFNNDETNAKKLKIALAINIVAFNLLHHINYH